MATNLEFINSFSTSSGVSNLNATSVFTDKYEKYFVTSNKWSASSNVTYLHMRFLDSSGNTISDTEYAYSQYDMLSYGNYYTMRSSSDNYMRISFAGGTSDADMGGLSMYIMNPYQSSTFTYLTCQSSLMQRYNGHKLAGSKAIGCHKSAEQLSGFSFFPSTGTFDTGCQISVYGVI